MALIQARQEELRRAARAAAIRADAPRADGARRGMLARFALTSKRVNTPATTTEPRLSHAGR